VLGEDVVWRKWRNKKKKEKRKGKKKYMRE
jgi:hypothetical protein